ncbi:MAG: hypothetical protein HC868_15220 [Sphingomonadales bacterium]|nr:hypothetical protein [Sphingomonadales bacterium]
MTLLIIGSQRSDQFAAAVATHAPDIDVRIWPDAGRIEDIRYALAWGPPAGALKTVPNLQLIVSVAPASITSSRTRSCQTSPSCAMSILISPIA